MTLQLFKVYYYIAKIWRDLGFFPFLGNFPPILTSALSHAELTIRTNWLVLYSDINIQMGKGAELWKTVLLCDIDVAVKLVQLRSWFFSFMPEMQRFAKL